ncbi:MAG: malto-oligosyltrehalose trehalohydrolase, partial [Rhodocyclales bacterium]|nr:malto-oligosyltrehalose trehalohydrolase [Rhodocyclales bacterium]
MMRIHRMPFGSELLASGGVRFHLWAPSAQRVELCLERASVPMFPAQIGWWAVAIEAATPGSRYRFRIDGDIEVPDPASRFNPNSVHGASEVIDAAAFPWTDGDWRGRPWHEAVIYELHVGAFTPEGTFAAATKRLEHLAGLGATAVELMPVADCAGRRNWGYDGVLAFAPAPRYGRPEDLKRLVQRAHELGIMVLLDVVYNHFGPEGNYLGRYAAPFFTRRHGTPWGEAIDFDGPESRTVRDFFIHNALYWVEEYNLDGLRLDAIHAIRDGSSPDIVEAIGEALHRGSGAGRHVHLILENDRNESHYLDRGPEGRPVTATAQWNDDFHHALHVLITGERDGYYGDYANAPAAHFARCLAEGFAWQGEASPYRGGEARGEPSTHLPAAAFVAFLQNHDQIGNRAFGERLSELAAPEALAAATAILLLQPAPPLLFMGEEFAARQRFPFFCDFAGELAAAVTAGRRGEFARFARFADPAARDDIPDPNAEATFRAAVLDWNCLDRPPHDRWFASYRELLRLRRMRIAPHLTGREAGAAIESLGPTALAAVWSLGDGSRLTLLANLGAQAAATAPQRQPEGEAIYLSDSLTAADAMAGRLPQWSVAWFLALPR